MAAVGGAAVGSTLELPLAGVAGAAAVFTAAARRPRPSAGAAAAGLGIGAVAALATTRSWPVAPRTTAEVRRLATPVPVDPRPEGQGAVIIVNNSAGNALQRSPVEQLAELLPAAKILETGDELSVDDALATAAESGEVIGMVGGDGSINAAAALARDRNKPLLVAPGGTLNHFARDLGVATVDEAAEALGQGSAVAIDLGLIDDQPFLNTASFGTYTELVDAREHLEPTIGKWPALLVSLVRVLRRASPCDVEIDGEAHSLWMVFVGNCRYHPHGFAPAWRERLDDGLLDVRMVAATHPFARVRLVLAVLTGRLGRSRVYEERTVRVMRVRSRVGPLRLARDGETFDGPASFDITKAPKALTVYVPRA
jgi:diacylglycerol kinase family enzyme